MSTAFIMAGTALAGAVVDGYGKYQQAKGQAKEYAAQAGVLAENAKQTRLEGAINEDRQRASNRQALSKMRAFAGEAGIADSATFLQSLAQDTAAAEQNALDIRYKTDTAAANLTQQAGNMSFAAKQAKKQGRNAFYMGLLSGFGSGIGSYYKYSTPVDKGAGKKDSFGFLWGK